MRIGTWNLAGRWTPQHEAFVAAADSDVWLLTEVNERLEVPGYHRHRSEGLMAAKRRWAGIYSRRPLQTQEDPHFASAAAVMDGTTCCASILPWRSCGPTWTGTRHAEKTELALAELLADLPTRDLVWGGDWNHALSGYEGAGTKDGRARVVAVVEKLGLRVPTADLPRRVDGHLSNYRVALAADHAVNRAEHLSAVGLSDHGCYVVEIHQARLRS